jgi:hypothetical protein
VLPLVLHLVSPHPYIRSRHILRSIPGSCPHTLIHVFVCSSPPTSPTCLTRTRISHRNLRPLLLAQIPPNRWHGNQHNWTRAAHNNRVKVRGLVVRRPFEVAQRLAEEERGGWDAGHFVCAVDSQYNYNVGKKCQRAYMFSSRRNRKLLFLWYVVKSQGPAPHTCHGQSAPTDSPGADGVLALHTSPITSIQNTSI